MRTVLIATAVILAATPAAAGDIGCLWGQLSEEGRQGFLEAHAAGGDALSRMADETGLEALVEDCVPAGPETETRKAAVGRAFAASMAELNAAQALARGPAPVQPFALNVAWSGLTPEHRQALVDQVAEGLMTATVTDALRAAVLSSWTASAKPGEPDGPTMLLLTNYFLSRALRVSAETEF